ncbi:MAG: zinc-ribbon domain-containing protein [Lachnospiraceae bacterium]|nr:zinc-ribbon domain-containing protein [Lachnospiraceae bacterium]
MFCTNCGTKIDDKAKFCTNCGVKIESVSPYTVSVKPEEIPTLQESAQTAEPSYEQQVAQASGNISSGAQAYHKKTNIGLIIGLAVGIPVTLLILLVAVSIGGIAKYLQKVEEMENSHYAIEEYEDPDPNGILESLDRTTARRTLLIYMVGTDLESPDPDEYEDDEDEYYGGAATEDICEICDAYLPDNVNIVIECGGANDWVHPDVPDGKVSRFMVEDGNITLLQNLGKTTMNRPGDLADFISFGEEYFPAENYTLVLWGHGGGIPAGFGNDQLGDYYEVLEDFEIRDELENAGVKFDAVIFDCCNMCTLEMARALDGYADYMVGAESYVNGIGIYYTEWLESLNGDVRSFCEKIVKDYMKDSNNNGMVASMSVIRLDMMDEVYQAYIDYLTEAKDMMDAGDYISYYQARGNCGYYETNDSVDLITLATSYKNDYSTELINAVVNSVVYTESDFSYGHGLMAYSPYESYDLYEYGRESFERLNYDSAITDFYDSFMSRRLAYLGEDDIEEYAGDWYIPDYEDETDYSASENYEIELIEGDSYHSVEISDTLWDNIMSVSLSVFVEENDTRYFDLGRDYTWRIDDNDRFALLDPEKWFYVNGEQVTYYGTSFYEDYDTGEWTQMGMIPALINGEECALYLYNDNENPDGEVWGYSHYNFETDVEEDDFEFVEDDDEIQIVRFYCDENFNYEYVPADEVVKGKDLKIEYKEINLDDYSTFGYYNFEDIFGDTYYSDSAYLGLAGILD